MVKATSMCAPQAKMEEEADPVLLSSRAASSSPRACSLPYKQNEELTLLLRLIFLTSGVLSTA